MAKHNTSSKPPQTAKVADEAPPQSQMRVRAPKDPKIEALYLRFKSGEITIDEAVAEMKKLSLANANSELSEDEYADLEKFFRDMPLPYVDQLRRSRE